MNYILALLFLLTVTFAIICVAGLILFIPIWNILGAIFMLMTGYLFIVFNN